jgi:regulator of sigma E protease
MSEPKGLIGRSYFRAFLLVVVLGAVIYLIFRNLSVFGNILLAVIGFGMVVIVHEFGHFIAAKLSGINVEAFSVGFPPILAGILRTENGYRVRILPGFFPAKEGESGESGEAGLSFTFGKGGKAWETEYRICLIPFGGYVKMLGQEDVGAAETSEDPRSYANKPVATRMGVIAAGVFFNIISAVVAFIIVFLVGVNLPPPVVGSVRPDSPAWRAGLKQGDEIIEIAGKSDNLDFTDIKMAAALAGKDEAIELRVRHEDGTEEDFSVVAEQLRGTRLKGFGVGRPMSLTIAGVSDVNALFEKTGLLPGDRIKAVNGREVQTYLELEEIVRDSTMPVVTLLAERTDRVSNVTKLIESQVKLNLYLRKEQVESEPNSGHICSMVPRLQIVAVSGGPAPAKNRFVSFLNKIGIAKADAVPSLQSGDIILAIGNVENPTYKEFREVTTEYEKKELPIEVLRMGADGSEETVTITVVPKRSKDGKRVVIGIFLRPAFDAEHPVVAKTISAKDGPKRLAIPRGAVITAVGGVGVSDFYDIIREVHRNSGKRIKIEYRLNDGTAGDVVLDAERAEDFITVEYNFADSVPFEYLERLYKASGPVDAVVMGYRKTIVFVAQAYLTLKRLFGGLVSPKEFMGPVGVVTLGYIILTEKPLIYYVYVLALISAFIAVLNSLPIPPFDGGHIVFLLVEKIKGSPVSERVQGAIAYAALVLLIVFAVYITFNDIIRSFLWLGG